MSDDYMEGHGEGYESGFDAGSESRGSEVDRLKRENHEMLELLRAVLAERMIYTGSECETLEDSGQFPDLFNWIVAIVSRSNPK